MLSRPLSRIPLKAASLFWLMWPALTCHFVQKNALRCLQRGREGGADSLLSSPVLPWNARLRYNHLLTLPSSLRVQLHGADSGSCRTSGGFPSFSDELITELQQTSFWAWSQADGSKGCDGMGWGGWGVLLKTTTCLHPASALSPL